MSISPNKLSSANAIPWSCRISEQIAQGISAFFKPITFKQLNSSIVCLCELEIVATRKVASSAS